MGERRRRRRRRRKADPQPPRRQENSQASARSGNGAASASGSRARRRERAPGTRWSASASPKSSEDLVRAAPRQRPATLTAPHDGQTLEQVIGDLQSEWGVPQYPQEYRITLRVADERDVRPERATTEEAKADGTAERVARPGSSASPRRERAPAMRVALGEESQSTREKAPGRRRRGRRRRRRGGGGTPAA
jgi:hypothetical protein